MACDWSVCASIGGFSAADSTLTCNASWNQVSSGSDGFVKVWDPKTAECLVTRVEREKNVLFVREQL